MEPNRRLPNRRQSTGNSRDSAPTRMTGTFLFLFFFGLVFVLMGLTLTAALGFFGLPFLFVGAVFAVNGGRMAFRPSAKDGAGAPKRTYTPEFDPDARDHEHIRLSPITQAKKAFHPPVSSRFDPDSRDHEHIVTSPDRSLQKQLEQLETMKGAGLIDDAEYKERKRRIMAGR